MPGSQRTAHWSAKNFGDIGEKSFVPTFLIRGDLHLAANRFLNSPPVSFARSNAGADTLGSNKALHV